eukprot:4927894-Alexandrium_andersonii.AAC.1
MTSPEITDRCTTSPRPCQTLRNPGCFMSKLCARISTSAAKTHVQVLPSALHAVLLAPGEEASKMHLEGQPARRAGT